MAKKKKELVITFDDDTIWDSAAKTLFRKTATWIDFRNKVVKERKVCELCGYEKRLTLHHIHLTDRAVDYANLIPERFKVMCSGCHKYGHRVFASYIRKKNPIKPDPLFEEILNKFYKND